MLILLAILIFAGGWFVFVRNKSKGKSNWILCLIMLLSPVLFHIIGLTYASYLHDQGQAFGSAYLALLLLFNSLVMLAVTILKTKKKKSTTNVSN
ncbi:hypothetical protein [Rossellomorea aquimaris]|uniref:NADH dehydrogenase subunit 4L n=1 Tax=Rossellomorea aquimaris TaxID=189382 RepID=A0A366ESK3_9BACI|nr:hypothetical protein [Rossellomorea aquimaris]RBP04455.1 hypothetical protein DET59_106247 [Rossellomorea aquimaris]